MALGSVQTIPKSGIGPSYATPGASEVILGTGPVILHVKNGAGSPITVTIVDPYLTPAGSPALSPTVSVPNAGERMIHIPASFFQNGQVTVTFSSVTSITAAVFNH